MRSSLRERVAAALGVLALACVALASATLAADVTDIGFLDQAAVANTPSFIQAGRQMQRFKQGLDRQFAERMRSARDQREQARIAAEFQTKLDAKQREVLGPLFARAQVAVASVASSKNLSVIVDKRIIVVGGQDVTKDVIDLLDGPSPPIPPVSTPPPSSVGYVDQMQIDQIPTIKRANDDFGKFQSEQQLEAQKKFKTAKTDQQRQAILKDYQQSLADRQKQLIAPLVERTRAAIAEVAKKKSLLLVIDRSNLIYGGLDITGDVTSDLK
jgi:outer membrane protein